SITIRKPSGIFISHDKFIKQGFYSRVSGLSGDSVMEDNISALITSGYFERVIPESLSQGKTIVFCGGTGSGKTTFANACLEYIPHHLRCISIEDTDEAKFRFHKNHVK
ncbi:ATPase, T2SS/T4P/T4SS family, partial [Escherichia coli]